MYSANYGKQYREKVKRSNVTFSHEEFCQIEKLAESLQMKPAVLIKRLALSALKGEQIQSPAMEEEVRGLTFLLRNIANNLNQIAHHSNRVKQVVDENDVFNQLRLIEQSLKDAYKRAKG